MDKTLPGAWFAWERSMSGLAPSLYPQGVPEGADKRIVRKHQLAEDERGLSLRELVLRYPMPKERG
jgi:hypothetical protein